MPISIKNPEAEKLVRDIAQQTGESLTDCIINALRERNDKLTRKRNRESLEEDLLEIADRVSRMPVRDNRSRDEILGYDEHGIPSR